MHDSIDELRNFMEQYFEKFDWSNQQRLRSLDNNTMFMLDKQMDLCKKVLDTLRDQDEHSQMVRESEKQAKQLEFKLEKSMLLVTKR